MDKKPFEQRGGQVTGSQQDPGTPEPGRRIPDGVEKNKVPRRPGEQSAGRPIDKSAAGPGSGPRGKDASKEERSDQGQGSGRPVQLQDQDESEPALDGWSQEGRKTSEGQPTQR